MFGSLYTSGKSETDFDHVPPNFIQILNSDETFLNKKIMLVAISANNESILKNIKT